MHGVFQIMLSKLRELDITSTDCPVLFGASPYQTYFELWHRKLGKLGNEERKLNERMKIGLALEDAIATYAARENGWKITKVGEYIRRADMRIGASFDYFVSDGSILEIKNVDGLEFKKKWDESNMPLYVEIQVQHQLLVTGKTRAYVAAMVGGSKLAIYERSPDFRVHDEIKARVARFWLSEEPAPDYVADADVIDRIDIKPEGIFVVNDDDIGDLIKKYNDICVSITMNEKARKWMRAELIDKLGDHKESIYEDYVVSMSRLDEKIGPLITKADVGKPKYTRAASTVVRVKHKDGSERNQD